MPMKFFESSDSIDIARDENKKSCPGASFRIDSPQHNCCLNNMAAGGSQGISATLPKSPANGADLC